MSPTVTNLASLNQDITCEAPRIPAPGETILGTRVRYSLGGKGGNQAVAAARLGANVQLIAAVGDDAAGREYVSALEDEGISTENVLVLQGESTGLALIEVDALANNSILVIPGANHAVTPDMVEEACAAVPGPDVAMSQLEVPLASVERLFRLARNRGAITILNPAPAVPLECLVDILRHTDVLVPNEIEMCQMLGLETVSPDRLQEDCAPLFGLGVRYIVVTLGASGCVVVEPESTTVIPAFPAKAVDTTAAGDSFLGAMAAALAEARTLDRDAIMAAVEWGTRAASLTVAREGAHPSLPALEEVLAL